METAPADISAIESDWPCCVCDYNLRGLALAGLCPECGTPIQQSLDFRYLGNSDRRWLNGISRGAKFASLITTIAVCYICLMLFAPLAWRGSMLVRYWLFSSWANLGLTLATFASFWMLARPETGGADARERRAAATVRVLIAFATVLSVVWIIVNRGGYPIVLQQMRVVAQSLVWMAMYFALLRYLGRIARRIPDARLQVHLGALSWALPLTVGMNLLSTVLGLAGLRWLYAQTWVAVAIFGAGIIVRAWSAFELWRLGSKLRRVVPVAAESL